MEGSSKKKESGSSGAVLDSSRQDAARLPPEDYLEKYGVNAYLKDALTVLLENRPANAIEFLADYFKNAIRAPPPLVRSYRYIKMCSVHDPCFGDNIVLAYSTFNNNRDPVSSLCRGEFLKLLRMLASEYPDNVVDMVLPSSRGEESDEIGFAEFVDGVKCMLSFDDFGREARRVFVLCDCAGRGVIDRDSAVVLWRQYVLSALRLELKDADLTSHAARYPPSLSFGDFLMGLMQILDGADVK